jgi:uncharacterized protein YndB with AHSA1/START domain
MNEDHRIEIAIAAPPSEVYEAIATEGGIHGWWTEAASVDEEVGGVSRFSFGEEHGWFEMRVDSLVPGEAVGWTCVAQDQPSFEDPEEWVGTRVTFGLEPDGEGTLLRFAHHGLEPLPCAEVCRRGWSHFIEGSLRSLLENGRGTPHLEAATTA